MSVKIVAEIGCNHLGSVAIARDLIREAKRCGCDYVKFQKRHLGAIPDEVKNRPCVGEHSFGATYLAHREALEFDGLTWRELQREADLAGIGFFGTAFDIDSAEFLCAINTPYLKIGSGQVRDAVFLDEVYHLDNCPPVIASTGMCTEGDVRNLIDHVDLAILVHTTSSYPCPENEINLKWITTGLKQFVRALRIDIDPPIPEIGLSGHYGAGNGAIEAAAVALGATYIERHFTLDRTWKGTDQAASLEPVGMMNVVKAIRQIERAMGDGVKQVMPSEKSVLEKCNRK